MVNLGDYVGQKHPTEPFFLKKGIIVESKDDSYVVQWLSFNRKFWMGYEGEVFSELSKRYLLTKMSYNRSYNESNIIILSKAGTNGMG